MPQRAQKHPAGFGNHARGVFQRGGKGVQHIPQPRGSVANAVRKVYPSLGRFNRNRARPIFRLSDRVVTPQGHQPFLINHGMGNVGAQPKTNAAAGAGFDKPVHGAGVKRILPIHKLGMQHYIALLG